MSIKVKFPGPFIRETCTDHRFIAGNFENCTRMLRVEIVNDSRTESMVFGNNWTIA